MNFKKVFNKLFEVYLASTHLIAIFLVYTLIIYSCFCMTLLSIQYALTFDYFKNAADNIIILSIIFMFLLSVLVVYVLFDHINFGINKFLCLVLAQYNQVHKKLIDDLKKFLKFSTIVAISFIVAFKENLFDMFVDVFGGENIDKTVTLLIFNLMLYWLISAVNILEITSENLKINEEFLKKNNINNKQPKALKRKWRRNYHSLSSKKLKK